MKLNKSLMDLPKAEVCLSAAAAFFSLFSVRGAMYRAIDLHPKGVNDSFAVVSSGARQIGHADGHALIWAGTADSVQDINPSNFSVTAVSGISGTQMVGAGAGTATQGYVHALLWTDEGDTIIDLSPYSLGTTVARGISGKDIVGRVGFPNQAVLWSGDDHTLISLHPAGFLESEAWAISANQQVGYGYGPATTNQEHALLWSGSARNVVDLNPKGFVWSICYAVAGNQHVGVEDTHALLWRGAANGFVDLNSSGFEFSTAYGTSGTHQVGWASGPATGGFYIHHAVVWSGTADSVVDLHNFLSADYANSEAYGVDENGNIVGYAMYTPTSRAHAILWTPIPNSMTVCNDQGLCGAVWTCPATGSNTSCNPACGSLLPVGTTTITCTTTNPSGTGFTTERVIVTVKDCEPPNVSCRTPDDRAVQKGPSANGNITPPSGSGRFYELLAHDNCDDNPQLYIQDLASGFVRGPFLKNQIVKIAKKTHGKGAAGSASHSAFATVELEGDGFLYGVDFSGNVGLSVFCANSPQSR